jgi:hypothetical protein
MPLLVVLVAGGGALPIVERSRRIDRQSLSLRSKPRQTELLPVEDEDREDVESRLVEETSGDDTSRHAVQNVSNKLLRDVDLHKNRPIQAKNNITVYYLDNTT